MDYTKQLVETIKPILKDYGFFKKALNWFYENKETLKIFNIQKSLYSRKIYLNIGIKIKALDPNISYKFPGSHIGTRLDHLVKKEILDFESEISIEERTQEIVKMLKSNPYEFFTLTSDIESINKFIIESKSIYMVALNAKNYLGINS